MIAVELRGVHMMACAYLHIVHMYYSGFARSFTTCRNYVIFVIFAHIITHTTVIILRCNTVIINSVRGLRFLFWMLRTSTLFILGCSPYLSWVVHETIVRACTRYIFLVNDTRYIVTVGQRGR